MFTYTFDGERFTTIKTGRISEIHASQKRGRWYFRYGDQNDNLLASGVTPVEFVQSFWFGELEV